MRIGPFELLEPVGLGGSARVWRGTYAPGGSEVAVKFLRPEAFATTGREQFVREVHTSARLAHPSIVSVYDYGTLDSKLSGEHDLVEGLPYLVMEYSEFGELEAPLVDCWDVLRGVLLQVLDALAYAHARTVVHRDIKPANILLFSTDGEPTLKLSDFGIAQALDPDATRVDPETLAKSAGTPHYMPPEQLKGQWRRFGPWTDLYALGCTAWEFVAGQPPFAGRNVAQMVMAHLAAPLPALEPGFATPDGFESWLHTMMAKEPNHRFACAADAAASLVAIDDSELDSPVSATVGAPDPEHDADTIIDVTTRMETLSLDTPIRQRETPRRRGRTTSAGSERSAQDVRETMSLTVPVQLAGVPGEDEWRRAAGRASQRSSVRGLGLSLFSLRETPLVGRDEPCERIWNELRRVHLDGGVRGVLVRGDAGTGKTRLVREMVCRAEELGAATMLRATHSRLGGPADGLARMLERYFLAWELESDACIARITGVLEQLSPDEAAQSLDRDARILAETIGAVARDESGASSVEARYAALCRFVARLNTQRPVVIWLDDLQWSGEALEWIEFLCREEPQLDVLVACTVLEDFSDSAAGMRRRIDTLSSGPEWLSIGLERLGERAHRALIDSLLAFSPDVADRLAACTRGEPLFAWQLVSDLVDADVLSRHEGVYRLPSDYELPGSMDALWLDRLERLLGSPPAASIGNDESDLAWTMLELAAVLGTRVVEDEWRAACRKAGLGGSHRVLERLARAGMVELGEDGWALVHQTLGMTLQATARDGGRLAAYHRICAEVLRELYPRADRWQLARIAEHAFEGGASQMAVGTLRDAIEAMTAVNEMQEAERLLDLRGAALDRLGAARGSRQRLVNELLRVGVDRAVGRPEQARAALERVIDRADQRGWKTELVEALRESGELHANDGEVEAALTLYDRALEEAADLDAPRSLARLYQSKGWAYKTLGRFDDAHDVLQRAREIYVELGDEVSEVSLLNPIGFTWLAQGDLTRTRQVCRQGIRLAGERGLNAAEAGFWTTLGEVERFDSNWEEARRCYDRAERLDKICGSKHQYLVRFNALMADIGAGEYAEAREGLEQLEPALVRVGFHGWLQGSLELMYARCDAGMGQWDTAVEHGRKALEIITEQELVERDIAALAEELGNVARDAGYDELASDALSIARDQWREIEGD